MMGWIQKQKNKVLSWLWERADERKILGEFARTKAKSLAAAQTLRVGDLCEIKTNGSLVLTQYANEPPLGKHVVRYNAGQTPFGIHWKGPVYQFVVLEHISVRHPGSNETEHFKGMDPEHGIVYVSIPHWWLEFSVTIKPVTISQIEVVGEKTADDEPQRD